MDEARETKTNLRRGGSLALARRCSSAPVCRPAWLRRVALLAKRHKGRKKETVCGHLSAAIFVALRATFVPPKTSWPDGRERSWPQARLQALSDAQATPQCASGLHSQAICGPLDSCPHTTGQWIHEGPLLCPLLCLVLFSFFPFSPFSSARHSDGELNRD